MFEKVTPVNRMSIPPHPIPCRPMQMRSDKSFFLLRCFTAILMTRCQEADRHMMRPWLASEACTHWYTAPPCNAWHTYTYIVLRDTLTLRAWPPARYTRSGAIVCFFLSVIQVHRHHLKSPFDISSSQISSMYHHIVSSSSFSHRLQCYFYQKGSLEVESPWDKLITWQLLPSVTQLIGNKIIGWTCSPKIFYIELNFLKLLIPVAGLTDALACLSRKPPQASFVRLYI